MIYNVSSKDTDEPEDILHALGDERDRGEEKGHLLLLRRYDRHSITYALLLL